MTAPRKLVKICQSVWAILELSSMRKAMSSVVLQKLGDRCCNVGCTKKTRRINRTPTSPSLCLLDLDPNLDLDPDNNPEPSRDVTGLASVCRSRVDTSVREVSQIIVC